MAGSIRAIAVGWEHEVLLEEIEAARESSRAELEAYFQEPVDSLSDADVARFLVQSTHPTTRYLKPDVQGLGFAV